MARQSPVSLPGPQRISPQIIPARFRTVGRQPVLPNLAPDRSRPVAVGLQQLFLQGKLQVRVKSVGAAQRIHLCQVLGIPIFGFGIHERQQRLGVAYFFGCQQLPDGSFGPGLEVVRHERAGWRANQPCTQPAKKLLVFSENHRKPRRAKLPVRHIKNNPPQNLPPTDGELCFLARNISDRELLLTLVVIDTHAFAGKSQLDRICRNEKPSLLQSALPWLEQSILKRDPISRGSRRPDLEAGFSLSRDQTGNIEAGFFDLRLQTGGFTFFGARRRGAH